MDEQLHLLFLSAIKTIDPDFAADIEFSVPQNKDHGDLATNIALQLAKPLKKAPRAIAEAIIVELQGKHESI